MPGDENRLCHCLLDGFASSRDDGAEAQSSSSRLHWAGHDPAPEVLHDDTAFYIAARSRVAADLRFRVITAKGGLLKLATQSRASTSRAEVAREQAFLCARTAADLKAKDVVVLDMRGVTPLYDFFVLCTGNSRRQIHALAEDTDAAMHAEGEKRLSIEGYEASKWVVQDYGDIVVHVFDSDARAYYALEDLWADAPRLDWQRS